MTLPTSIVESVSLRQVFPAVFETIHKPERMGNTANIAYGGCTIATALNAAYSSVPVEFYLYSLTGHFMGPVLVDRTVRCKIATLRETRTFVTVQVLVLQRQNDGNDRLCLEATADFQAAEKASMFNFSKPPSMRYTSAKDSTATAQRAAPIKTDQDTPRPAEGGFSLMGRYFDVRQPTEAINAHHFDTKTKTVTTSQDNLSVTDKTTALWLKTRQELNQQREQAVALAFIQDAGLSFVPLVHNHLWLDDAAACSSLDFALRIFVNDLDLSDWHLRESRCIAAGVGRTYSEAQVWDAAGRMVSSMTQQSILRPGQTPRERL